MTSSDMAAWKRDAEVQLARGNHSGAFDILAALVKTGGADTDVFNSYRRLHNSILGCDIPHAQIFNFIYETDLWEGGSGAGSSPQSTERYRAFLKDFITENGVRSVVDAGCGDWQSSRLIDWSEIDYLGIDVSSVVLNNTKRFARDGVRFIEGDARTLDLPAADLLIMKDVLQHWANSDIMAIIPQFRKFRYCLITNGATEQVQAYVNRDMPAGGYRPVDLSQQPFSIPGSFELLYDVPYVTHSDGPVRSTMRVFLIDRNKQPAEAQGQAPLIIPQIFAGEYDLGALHLLTPRGHAFRMYVAPRYREHYEHNSYEQFSAALASSILRRAEVFLDVGASYGFYSLLAGSRHPDLDIIAVEPTPTTCAVLKRNVELLGRSNVAVHQFAVSDSIGRRPFNVALASDSCGFFDHPNVDRLQSIDVETTTVDALLKDRKPCPLVIKIDTEGNELAVLRGMTATLERFPDIRLLIEYCPDTLRAADVQPAALLEHLDRLGFLTFIVDEERQRFYRAQPACDSLRRTKRNYANLYCVRKDRALNVCFFSHSSDLAGAERVLLELVDDLVVDHDAVCSVVLPDRGPLAAALANTGAATIIAPYCWWCTTRDGQLTEAQKLQRVRQSGTSLMTDAVTDIRLVDPDIIWSQTMVIPWGAMVAATLRKPHLWYVTEFGERDHDFVFFSPLAKILREIERGSDLIYTCSKAVAQELFADASDEHVRTLYCLPRAPNHQGVTSGQDDQYFHVPGAVKLGIFGTLVPQKGQEDILLAVADLTRRGRNVELLVAGYESSPEYRRHLADIVVRHQLSDHVRFAGMLPDPYPAMRAVDIVVVCSRCEAFGRTAVEAMLLGKPVIYSNTGGFLETMVEGQTGLSYTPGDIDGLVEQLERLIANPSQRRVMGDFGRARATKLFSKDAFSGEVNRALRKLRAQGDATASSPATIEPYFSLGACLVDELIKYQERDDGQSATIEQHRDQFNVLRYEFDKLKKQSTSRSWLARALYLQILRRCFPNHF
jgi:FkbM family methyltransferase